MKNKITIRKAGPADAPGAAETHSVSAIKAYTGILPDVERHFSAAAMTEYWTKQIANSVERPDLYRALVAVADTEKIIGVGLASILDKEQDAHLMPLIRKAGIRTSNPIGNINTTYIHPDYQRMNIGSGLVYNIAASGMMKNAEWILTETLNEYQASPKFYIRMGAKHIGSYTISFGEHYKNDSRDSVVDSQVYAMKKDDVILNLWLMKKSDIISEMTKGDAYDKPRS